MGLPLPLQAQLNVQADELTGIAHETSDPQAFQYIEYPFFPGTKCQLVLDDSIVSNKLRHKARDVRRTQAMYSYMATKYLWTQQVLDSIDWIAHQQAIGSWTRGIGQGLPRSQNRTTFLNKFIHGWLPVGKQVARYDAVLYPRNCPSCPHQEESQTHFLQCPARTSWQNTFRSELRKQADKTDTDPVLLEILLEGVQRWFNQEPFHMNRYENRYRDLFRSQRKIGWLQLLHGRWSQDWRQLQDQYLCRTNKAKSKVNHGSAWVLGLIKVIWSQCYAAWLLRNDDRHGKEDDEQRQIQLDQAQRRIEVLYLLKPLCPISTRTTWFYTSTDLHFQREPHLHQLQNWLTTYEPMIREQSRKRQSHRRQGIMAIDDALANQHNNHM